MEARSRVGREAINLHVNILLVPEGKSRQPVLLFDRSLSQRPISGREYARRGCELRTGDSASDGARSDSHLGIIPDAFVFPRVAACLHIQLVVPFSKPHGRRHSHTSFAEGGEADVFLTLKFARDGHGVLVSVAAEALGVWKSSLPSTPTMPQHSRIATARLNSWPWSKRSGRSGRRFPCANRPRCSPAWRETS
jgi:hypothetical protein